MFDTYKKINKKPHASVPLRYINPTLSGILCEQSCLGKNLILTSFGSTVFIFPADPNLSKLSLDILFSFTWV